MPKRARRAPLHEVGADPDVRFSYANERTFSGVEPHALALIAAGLAVTTLLPRLDVEYGRRIIGVPLITLGAVLAWASYRRWEDNERAMRLASRCRRRTCRASLRARSLDRRV